MPLAVLSYNVWGIFISQHLDERMKEIGRRAINYDVVCLQEQFEQRHSDIIFSNREHFKYVERFVSCEYGSGLTIASRYPIVATMFLPFYSCGRPERVQEGDFIANKGIAAVRISVPASVLEDTRQKQQQQPQRSNSNSPNNNNNNGAAAATSSSTSNDEENVEIIVCNTHFVAQYEKYKHIGGFFNETNAASRLTEAYEMGDLACLMHGTTPTGRTPLILCGDFNAGQDSHEMKLLHDFCELKGVLLNPALKPDQATYTTDNCYVKPTTNEAIPIQIDHMLYADLEMTESKLAFNEKVRLPGAPEPVHLSDHFGVSAVFSRIVPAGAPTTPEIKRAQDEMLHVSKYLRDSGHRYNLHFKLMMGAAALIFGVGAAGWVTDHPLFVATTGFVSCFLIFIAVGHRRHEAEYYYRIAANLTGLISNTRKM